MGSEKALGKSKHRKATAFRASYPAGHSVADAILSLFGFAQGCLENNFSCACFCFAEGHRAFFHCAVSCHLGYLFKEVNAYIFSK